MNDRSAILRDGQSVRVRALGREDRRLLVGLFAEMSESSLYFRFFHAVRRVAGDELDRLLPIDTRDVVLGVVQARGSAEELLGAAWSMRSGSASPASAEVAFAVADRHQGRGVGTVLLEHLAELGRAQGVEKFDADVLAENDAMIDVFVQSGFEVARASSRGVVHVTFPIEELDKTREVIDERWSIAARESLRPILAPRSIALVGASAKDGSIGRALLINLRERFTGRVVPIHPHAPELLGLRAYPSVSRVPDPVDLAVIAVRAEKTEAIVEDCASAGVRGLVVISAGFAEVSEAGKALERRVRDRVRSAGMRMVGPNCIGILNTDPAVRLDAEFGPVWPIEGNVGILSQSGAIGLALLDQTRARGIGVSTFVSVGNKADVSGNDLLAYWLEDPRTSVVALYLESFGNPQRFSRIAPLVARKKPIVAVKSGRSPAGLRAASSHSAALASPDAAVDALFEQAGVIRTDTFQEMLDVVTFLSAQPPPPGSRIGVITNAGGPGIMFADACEANGLELPRLAPETMDELRSFLPAEASVQNPVDMIASAGPEEYERAMRVVARDAAVDAIVAIHIPPFRGQGDRIGAAIARGAAAVPAEKPVAVVFIESNGAPETLFSGARGRLPAYTFPENAARALAASARYARWKAQPVEHALVLDRPEVEVIRACIARALAANPDAESVWLSAEEVSVVLRAAGIASARVLSAPPSGAEVAAAQLGYPLVVKGVARGVIHKSDLGLVVIGVRSSAELQAAVEAISTRARAAGVELDGLLFQREVPRGLEMIAGITRDPTFGPIVLAGLGGVEAEALRDTCVHLPPVSKSQAAAMLDRLRGGKLLGAFRGRPSRDRRALISIIERVSALAIAAPEIAEMDLNPVMVGASGEGATVLDARVRVTR